MADVLVGGGEKAQCLAQSSSLGCLPEEELSSQSLTFPVTCWGPTDLRGQNLYDIHSQDQLWVAGKFSHGFLEIPCNEPLLVLSVKLTQEETVSSIL